MVNDKSAHSGVFAELVNYDRLYESVSNHAILINHFDIWNEADKERLNNLLYTTYEGDVLDTKPSCDCGEFQGEYNRGIECHLCGTEVLSITERPMESILWARVPEGVHGFISPAVWNIFNETLTSGSRGFKVLRWLVDPTYRPALRVDPQKNPLLRSFIDIGWTRSVNNFIENFDLVLKILFHSEHRTIRPKVREQAMIEFIEENRHKFFPKYLPIPNRAIMITEKTPMITYVDEVMHSAIDAVRTLTSIESGMVSRSQRVKENRTAKAVDQLATYYNDYMKESIGKKPGMMRRQVFGSRLDFSGRAVISSVSGPHIYDELIMPWGLSILMLKTHLTNKLLRRGFTPDQCEEFLLLHINHYSPLLDELFQQLISESTHKGLPVIFQRNPSLVRGSAQHFYVTKINPNPKVNTIGISTLVLGAPNADFDSHCRFVG